MRRFSSNDRVNFLKGDYYNDPLPGQYNLIVSAMSIHHLSDDEKCHSIRGYMTDLQEKGYLLMRIL